MKIGQTEAGFLNDTRISDGLGDLSGFVQADSAHESKEEKIVKTCCRGCIGNCGVLAHVKNGRVIKLEGDPDHPMSRGAMCAKGLSSIQALYHPNRNKYPMMRVGERGENKWKRVSWEEAFSVIAEKLMETREKYGAEAVLCSTGGGGNPEFFSAGRFCNAFGTPNWFEPGSAQCFLPRTLSYTMMHGQIEFIYNSTSIADGMCQEIYYPDETPIKTLVIWGNAPSCNSPSQGGRAVVELKARGVKTVVVDPRMTAEASKADVWLPIRAGTDVALMLSWIKHIIDYKLYDEEMILKWSNLPFLVNPETKLCLRESDLVEGGDSGLFMIWDKKSKSAKPLIFPWDDSLEPALEGRYSVNGMECATGFQLLKERVEPYTIQKAAEICWLDAQMIEKAIKLYAQNTPSGISLGVATDQTPNSTQAAMAAATLDMLMGNVEKPGALLQNFKGMGDVSYATPLVGFLPEEQLKKRLGGSEYKGLLGWWVGHQPSILEAIKTGNPYKPRVWIERSANKFATVANPAEWEKVMKELDFIVHIYTFPTSFSAYADILLPATEWLETEQVVSIFNQVFVRQAVTHLWETMNETAIWTSIAKKCAELGHEGCKAAFDPQKTAPELPMYDNIREMSDAVCMRTFDMSFEELASRVPYEVFPHDEWKRYYTYKKIDPETGKPRGFGTPSRKLEIYSEGMVMLGRTGQPFSTYPLPPASKDYDPLPYYLEPAENPMSKLAEEYPLVMTNGRSPLTHHSTMRNIPWIRELYPVAEIWIHPDAAEKYGIAMGDWVWIESVRGKIRARAYVTKGINPGVVSMDRFWNPETMNTKTRGWKEMNVNMLAKNDAPFNDVTGTYTLRGYMVKVYKADGPPDGVWTKPEEFKAWLPEPSARTGEVQV